MLYTLAILYVMAIPVIVEVFLDKILWALGLNDKPASTIVRAVMMAGISVWFHLAGIAYWWQTSLVLIFFHWMVFDYIINIVRGEKWYYIPKKKHWYERFRRALKLKEAELMLKVWCFIVAYGIYAHLDWIYEGWTGI